MSKKIVVIGGSAAGPKAAARAKRLDPDAGVTIIQKAPEMSMASCGYPYFVGGLFNITAKRIVAGSDPLQSAKTQVSITTVAKVGGNGR